MGGIANRLGLMYALSRWCCDEDADDGILLFLTLCSTESSVQVRLGLEIHWWALMGVCFVGGLIAEVHP